MVAYLQLVLVEHQTERTLAVNCFIPAADRAAAAAYTHTLGSSVRHRIKRASFWHGHGRVSGSLGADLTYGRSSSTVWTLTTSAPEDAAKAENSGGSTREL